MRNISLSLAMIAILALPTAVRAQDSLNGELEPIRTQIRASGTRRGGGERWKDHRERRGGRARPWHGHSRDARRPLSHRLRYEGDDRDARRNDDRTGQAPLGFDDRRGAWPGAARPHAEVRRDQARAASVAHERHSDRQRRDHEALLQSRRLRLHAHRLSPAHDLGLGHEARADRFRGPAVSLLEPRLHHRRRDDRASIGRAVGEADHDAHFRAAGAQVRRPRTAGDVRKIRCSRRSRRRRQGQHLAEAVGSLR